MLGAADAEHSTADRRLLFATAFLRAVATGLVGVLLGLYLDRLGLAAGEIGIVFGTGLSGAVFATVIVTFLGDRLGRRRTLVALAAAAALGGLTLAVTTNLLAICLVAFAGMVNAMGRDRAAALALEQAILPGTVEPAHRTLAFAWYNVLQDIGHAVGGLAAAAPVLLRSLAGMGEVESFQAVIAGYAAVFVVCLPLYLRLSPQVEHIWAPGKPARLTARSRGVLWRISALFGLDSFAGGFLATALLAYFFHERFGAGEAAIAVLFFLARIANAGSHFGAAWLARHIGLVNTMVFTHIPASLLLFVIPFMPNFAVAAVVFIVREALVEMDVPTRQSYVMAVVEPHERTFASGVTLIVRLGGWATAPFIAGFLMQGLSLAAPLFVGGGAKVVYDLLLWRSFRHLKPPEERDAPA